MSKIIDTKIGKLLLEDESEEFLADMALQQITLDELDDPEADVNKACPDVVFYKNGPQYWAELATWLDEEHGEVFKIEQLKRIVEL